jgi:hypothetical protein
MTSAIFNIPTVHFYSESGHKVICLSLKGKRVPVAPARTMMSHGEVELYLVLTLALDVR